MRLFNFIYQIALCTCVAAVAVQAQNLKANFNALPLAPQGYYNGSDGSGGFANGGLFFRNRYTPQFSAWDGWAYASLYDTTTAGFTNQYSTAAGSGATDIPEERFALAYILDNAVIRRADKAPFSPKKCMFTNNTYAYLSMKNGDAFSKKFGGPTGNDPDFFKILIKGLRNGNVVDTTSFFLADYRFPNNTQDYIIKNWTMFNFPPSFQGALFDSLVFEMASSDVGQFGINTPTYFCMDEFEYSLQPTSAKQLIHTDIQVFPNPTLDRLHIRLNGQTITHVQLLDVNCRLMMEKYIGRDEDFIEISTTSLPSGIYWLRMNNGLEYFSHKVQKQ